MSSINADLRTVGTDGLAGYVPQVNFAPCVCSSPYLYCIAEGRVSRARSWSKTGYNEDVDVGTEDLWSVGGEYVWCTGGMQMELVSSDAGDHATGQGVRAVRLDYVTTAGSTGYEILNMAGTAAVNTTCTIIKGVQNFRAATCGTAGRALGNVDIRHLADTPIYSRISAGYTRARNITWTVPTGKTLYVTSVSFSVGGATKEKCAILTTLATYDNNAGVIRDFFIPYHEIIVEDGNFVKELEMPTKLPAGTRIKVRAQGLTADCVCNAYLRGWLEDE